MAEVDGTLDLDISLPGEETVIGQVDQSCAPGGSAEIWAIREGGHAPFLSADFARYVVEYFMAHPRNP